MTEIIFIRNGETRENRDGHTFTVDRNDWPRLVRADIALLQGLHTLCNREGPR